MTTDDADMRRQLIGGIFFIKTGIEQKENKFYNFNKTRLSTVYQFFKMQSDSYLTLLLTNAETCY